MIFEFHEFDFLLKMAAIFDIIKSIFYIINKAQNDDYILKKKKKKNGLCEIDDETDTNSIFSYHTRF